MSFALFTVGALLLIATIRNTQGDLFALVQGDFTGPNNFVYWTISILVVGSLGYIPKFKTFSTAFLALIIIVLFLTRGNPSKAGGGFFTQFTNQLKSTQTPAPASTGNLTSSSSSLIPSLPDLGKLIPQFNF